MIQIKLRQLLAAELIDEIILSTNDADIISFAQSLSEPRLHLHQREEHLAYSETSTDHLVAHAHELVPNGHVLWTHVTSPFITDKHYDQIINIYFEQLGQGYDSLMTTTAIHAFLWQDEQPINYDRSIEKWPRTQTLKPVHEINSGVFLASSIVYRDKDDRIGDRPYLFNLDKLTSFDIDWPEDFVIAECIFKQGLVRL